MNKLSNINIENDDFKDHIGFSTNIFSNPEDICPFVEKIGAHFKVIEIEFENRLKNIFNYGTVQKMKLIDRLLSIKEKNALNFSVHGPYAGRSTDIASTNVDTRNHAVKVMKEALDITHALGATIFTCHPGYLDKEIEFEKQMMNNLNFSLDELAPYADKLGITISLENTGRHRPKYIVLDYEKHQQLCETHGIGITLDLIHYTSFNSMGHDYFDGLKTLIHCIKNIHFSDMKMPYHAHLPLGEGNFDYHNTLNFLYKNGYTGNAIIEETGMRYPKELYLTNAIAYKNTLQQRVIDNAIK